MQKEGVRSSASDCVDDACLTRLARKPIPCHCCLCLRCLTPLKIIKVSRTALSFLLSAVECHRPEQKATGHGNGIIGQTCFAGRHPTLLAGQFFLLKPAADSSRGQVVYGMEFSNKCEHGHTPYHTMDSREHGPRPSGHQSRISTHDGLKAKCAISISNEMQAQNTSKDPNPYHG